MNINKIRKNIGNIQRKTDMEKTISKTKQVSNILRHQITQKTAEQQIATHATKDNIEASNYHQFAIQPLNTSKPLSKDEIIECQALKHFFTLKDDNGEYKSIPIELVLETKDEIENAYKKQVPNMELPSVDYSLKHSSLLMGYNWDNFGITYFPANVPLKPENDLKTVLLYIKDEKLKINVNKILKSSNDEQKALLCNCYIYYSLAHEYKHFDQFSLITKVFGAETPNALGELNCYLKTKQKLTNTTFFTKFGDDIEKTYTNLFSQKVNDVTNEEKMQRLGNKAKELDEEYKFLFTTDDKEKNDDTIISAVKTKQIEELDDFEEIIFNFFIKIQKKSIRITEDSFSNNMKSFFGCNITSSQIKQKLKNAGKNEDDFKTYLTLKILSTVYNNIISSSISEENNNSEKREKLYEKLDKVEDNNERLNIIKNSIKNGTIDLIDSEKRAILSYQKNCDKANNKEITDEEKIMAQKYVDGTIGYSLDDLDIYYNSSLEQEAYGYQIQKSLELFNKIKQSELEHKNLESFKEDIQKRIAGKEKKIEEEKKKIEEEINAKSNIIKNKEIDLSQIMINSIIYDMHLKPNSGKAKEILKELDKKLNFNQLIKDIATSYIQVEPNSSEAKEILKELDKTLNSSQFKEILEKYELKLDSNKLEK